MYRLGLGWCLILGCGPNVPDDGGNADGTSGPGTQSGPETSPPGTTAGPTSAGPTTTPPPDSTSGSTSISGSESDDEGTTVWVDFIQLPDGGGGCDTDGGGFLSVECSTWDQDCCPGEKCQPWANDGGEIWNATRCSPIDDEPGQPGDPCTVEGSNVSGVDSCDLAVLCWDVDPETNEGECVAMCTGDEGDPQCPDGTGCVVANDGVLILCLPDCDPLAKVPCLDGHSCHPFEDRWQCLPDGAQVYYSGLNPPACPAGSTAVDADVLDTCTDPEQPCCADICDVTAPACPAGTECLPVVEGGNAGVCVDAA